MAIAKRSYHEVSVNIKASAVVDNKNGTFTVALPGIEMSPDQAKVVEQLLPDLQEGFYRLLNQQALLKSLATPSEVAREPLDQPIRSNSKFS